jgi:hypothetical protein
MEKNTSNPMKISQGTADAQPFAFGSAFSIKIKGLSDYPSNVLIQKTSRITKGKYYANWKIYII